MIHENLPNGTDRWIEQGMERDLAEALHRGRREVLLRQLCHKFGPLDRDSQQRIEGVGADQLLRWSERLLKTDSLDEILHDDG